jgi:hypothetical protein
VLNEISLVLTSNMYLKFKYYSNMPSRCCVTGCKSNYDSSLRNTQNNRGVSVFKFPKNVERKQAWLKTIP